MKKIALGLAAMLPVITLNAMPPEQNYVPSNSIQTSNRPWITTNKIKVLIAHDKPQIQLNIDGKYRIFDPHTNRYIATRFVGKNQVIQSIHEGLKWGEEFPGLHQLRFIPGGPESVIYVDGVPYKGSVSIYDIGGTVSAVNELNVEDYIYSKLAGAQTKQLPGEVQAALAIAARTQAYYHVQNPKSNFWDVDGSVYAYTGLVSEHTAPLFLQAIKNTHDIVMSLSGKFEGATKVFPIEWDAFIGNANVKQKGQKAMISISDATEMARKGEHADAILKKAFPQASLHLVPNE